MIAEVSVIIPTLNRGHTLGKTLASVQRQTHQNWECLIIDDGSTDDTENTIQRFLNDERFKFIKRKNSQIRGAASCRNIGLELATGDFIQFLDSDDILEKHKFQRQLAISSSNSPILTSKWGKIVFKNGGEQISLYENLPTYRNFNNPQELFKTYAHRFCYLPIHSFLIPKKLIGSSRWNEQLTVNDDGDFMSRIVLKSDKILFCEDTFVLYRRGAGNRLSKSLETPKAYEKFILSWKIMENNLGKNHLLVRIAKRDLYNQISSKYPKLLQNEKAFFADAMPKLEYKLRAHLSKVLDKFQVKLVSIRENDIV